jgi:hypothetical protein
MLALEVAAHVLSDRGDITHRTRYGRQDAHQLSADYRRTCALLPGSSRSVCHACTQTPNSIARVVKSLVSSVVPSTNVCQEAL